MQPVRAPIYFVARNEFDPGVFRIRMIMAFDLQADPLGGHFFCQTQ